MAERIRINRESLEARKEQLQHWKVPAVVKRELLRFLDDIGLGKVNRGKKLSPERQLKYLNALRLPLEYFHKPTLRLRLRDLENFEKALSSGQLRTKRASRPYAHNTQVDTRKLLKIFLRWRLGEAKALALTNWLDTHYRHKTPDFLKETEIERLYKHCRNAEQRFLIAVLFDSGARAEEFHNIRFEDIYPPEGKENFVKVTLKQEYSKTLGRTITLYWKYSLEAVKEFLAERVAEGIKPADPVFAANYSATRKFLQRLGKTVLKRPVHYHLFRHSSATYYAPKLNRQELSRRFGWRFSSPMPDVYVSRAGMETKELDEKFAQTELSALKADIVQLTQAAKIKDERITQLEQAATDGEDQIAKLQRAMVTVRQDFSAIAKALSLNPAAGEVTAALNRKPDQNQPQNKPE